MLIPTLIVYTCWQVYQHQLCNTTSQKIHCPPPVWIGYHSDNSSTSNTGLIFYHHCPFDFCLLNDVDIILPALLLRKMNSVPLVVLCGACKEGLSLALGTSKYIPCTNYWLLLLVDFAVAGAALVFLLVICNLMHIHWRNNQWSHLYANLVQISRAIYIPTQKHSNDFLEVFIAWLNLDLGIQTCL